MFVLLYRTFMEYFHAHLYFICIYMNNASISINILEGLDENIKQCLRMKMKFTKYDMRTFCRKAKTYFIN